MARLLAAADLIRFQYEPFHNEIFRQLRFTAEEAEQTRDGLDLRTLELPPGVGWLLHKLKPWKRMHMVHRLGLGRLLTMPSALAVKRSSAVGLLSVSRPSVELFLRGGMALERLWLTATGLDLALQPLGSLPIFLAHWHQLGGSRLAATQIARVQYLSDRLRRLLPTLGGHVLQIMFRVGQSCASQVPSPPPKGRGGLRNLGGLLHRLVGGVKRAKRKTDIFHTGLNHRSQFITGSRHAPWH